MTAKAGTESTSFLVTATEKSKARTGTQAPRVLPRFAFDALKRLADEFGGVGKVVEFTAAGHPLCIFGFAFHDAGIAPDPDRRYIDQPYESTPVGAALVAVRVSGLTNDNAIRRLLGEKGIPDDNRLQRIPWDEYAPEMGFVRGDS